MIKRDNWLLILLINKCLKREKTDSNFILRSNVNYEIIPIGMDYRIKAITSNDFVAIVPGFYLSRVDIPEEQRVFYVSILEEEDYET
jgi:hypothetical protein